MKNLSKFVTMHFSRWNWQESHLKIHVGGKQNQPSRSRPINCLHQLQLKTFFSESKFDDLLTSIWRCNDPLTSICMMKWWSVDINKTRKCFVDINDEVVSCWWSYDQLPYHDVMICWHYCSEVMNMTHWHQYDEVMITSSLRWRAQGLSPPPGKWSQ